MGRRFPGFCGEGPGPLGAVGVPAMLAALSTVLSLLVALPARGQISPGRSPSTTQVPASAEQTSADRAEAVVVDPREFGVNIPPGKLVRGQDQRVLTRDENGQGVVAKVHVQVGDQRIVVLPDGRLAVRAVSDSPQTERPFEPLTKDELAERLRTGPLADFQTRQTRRYLYLFNTSEAFAVATGRIMESMFPGVATYAQSQRIEVHAPELPMVVIMFRTEAEFQDYKRMPPGVLAYYDPVSNHVVMFEQASNSPLKPELALQQAISTIAHEGAHQILHNIGVQQRLSRWPTWLAEGLAEYFAPTTTGQRLKWKGAGQVNDLRMFELEQYVQSRAADKPDGQMVEQTIGAARLTSTGYATAWALTHYLAKNHREQFHDYLRDISRLGPLEGATQVAQGGVIPQNRELFLQHFGNDLTDMERRLVLHLKKQPYRDPFAEWPHYVGLALIQEGRQARREARMFHTEELAAKWRRDLATAGDGEQDNQAQTQIRLFPNRALAERFIQQWLAGR